MDHARVLDHLLTEWKRRGRSRPDEMIASSWLDRAHQLMVAHYETILQPFGLSMARWECLTVLYWSKDGTLGFSTMADRLAVHPATVTYAVDQLEKAGFVERTSHPTDRRQRLASLTKPGFDTVEQVLDVLEENSFGLDAVTDKDLRKLVQLLKSVVTALDAAAPAHSEPVRPRQSLLGVARPARGGGAKRRRANLDPQNAGR